MESRLKLVYLDQRMLAEPIRLALRIGGVEFIDERIGHEEISRRRSSGELPYGQVPVLIDGEVVISQTAAILKWAGKRANLYDCFKSDEVESALADVRICMRPQWYGCVLGRSPIDGSLLVNLTEDQKKELRETLEGHVLPARFQALERHVEEPFFCGDRMTVCDLSWYNMCIGMLEGWYCPGISKAVLKDCPKLMNIAKAVHDLPAVKVYNKEHSYSTPPELD